MYYTSSVSHNKSKMIIDYCNIVLSIAITALFIAIVILRGNSGIIFPIEFILGALVNALTAVKNFISSNKTSGILLCVVVAVLLLMAYISWRVVR